MIQELLSRLSILKLSEDVCFERYVSNTKFSIKRLMHWGFCFTKYLMVKLHNHVDWSLKNWEHSSTYIAEEIRQG